MRRGRVAALSTLDEALRALRAELIDEKRLHGIAEDCRLVADARCERVEQALEELQEAHHAGLSAKANQEADLRRHVVAAAAAERAAKDAASRDGAAAWARDGPETDALKDAKVTLAEVLSQQDEARLQARREAALIQRDVEAAQAERAELRAAAERIAAPRQSFRASVWRLLKVARGAEDPTQSEVEGTLTS